MMRHSEVTIDKAMKWDDWLLYEMFGMHPDEALEELKGMKARGEVFIPCSGCEGFDPVTGCPGHPSETDSITKQ